MILKAKCPKCGKVSSSEYTGSKSADDLYYANIQFRFECANASCKPVGSFSLPYSFVVSSKDINFEDGTNSIYNWR